MRNKQGITIAALIIAIVGLSIGFAAFSNTLNISESASVNPDASNLKVVFAKNYFTEQVTTPNMLDTTDVTPTLSPNNVTGFTAGDAEINNDAQNGPELTGLEANFTAPGQSVTYTLNVVNAGKLKAYLTDLEFETTENPARTKTCLAEETGDSTRATDSLVEAACNGISISVKVGTLEPLTTSDPDGFPMTI